MQVSVLQEAFSNALNSALKAVENKPTLPVLANVLIEARDARLYITGNKLSQVITTNIGAKIAIGGEGSITLPARTLSDLISRLPNERIDMTLDEQTHTMRIQCGSTSANIKGIDAAEFPPLKHLSDYDVTMSGDELKRMIEQTEFSAARTDARPILTGIYIKFDAEAGVEMATADGYRLTVRYGEASTQLFDKHIILPAKALKDIASLIEKEEDDIQITLPSKTRSITTFKMASCTVSIQELEGRFPDYQAIIPESYTTAAICYTEDLEKACKRAQIFTRDNANSSGQLVIKEPGGPSEPGEVQVIGKSAERGDINAMLDSSVQGPGMEAIFSIPYLTDVLKVIGTERVIIESNGASHPGVFRPEGADNFVHVIMPMST